MSKHLFLFASITFGILNFSCHENKNKRMSSIVLNNGKKVKCKALSEIEYNKLRKEGAGEVIKELKDSYDLETYLLKTGQVIVVEGDYYTLYNSLDDVKLVLMNAPTAGQGIEVLRSVNIYGSDFPKQTNRLVEQLCVDLSLPFGNIDMDLLLQINRKVSGLQNSESFNEDHLINYIALIGQVVKLKYRADWDMQLAGDGQTWNPYMQINGQRVQFFTYLYEDIFLNPDNNNKSVILEVYQTVEDIIKNNL